MFAPPIRFASMLLALCACGQAVAQQAQVEFNTDFLTPQTRAGLDISRYERGNPVLPGEYRVELYLNGRTLGRTDLTVKPGANPDRGRVCMTRALLDQVGLDWNQLAAPALQALEDPAACPVLEDLLADARAEFDTGEQRLNLSIPQIALRRTPRGYVSPELWDSGVTGGMLGYTANAYRNTAAGLTTHSAYLGLNASFNAGDWRLRHNGAATWRSSGATGSTRAYQSLNTYVERDLPAIMGRLTLGEGNTTGDLFNSQSFRGIRLASDDRMLPDSQRGYAPVVRGIAETNARVTVRQRGMLLYDMPVAPGPFAITDLFPTGYGGDLDVTITEGDGRVRTFTVPYSSVPQLLRPGMHRYSLTAGTLRNTQLASTPMLLEATYQRGLTNMVTGYGGVQASRRYAAALGGVALGTPIGALSLDVSGAHTRLPNGHNLIGSALRAGYSKAFESTGSTLSLAAYRFASKNYLGMADAMRAIDTVERGFSFDAIARPRSQLSLSLSQPLGDRWGQLFLSGSMQNYWGGTRRDTQFQLGYSNQYGALSYSISAARTRDGFGRTNNAVMLNLWIPLGTSPQAPRLGTSLTHDTSGTAVQTMLMGSAGEGNQFSYGATAAHGPGGASTSGTVNGQYVGTRATVMAGYGVGRGYSNLTAGVSGSLVAHPGGVTFSSYSGDTVAVVAAAPEAAGARVMGYPGIVLDASGHAVLPYLMPYRINEVAIDPNGISPDVELKTTSQQVAPRAGAIVMLRYATAAGRAVLIDASLPGGATLPFGADVVDGEGHVVGSVGQAGRIYARLSSDQATLSVRWGQAPNQQCSMQVALPPATRAADPAAAAIERVQLACIPATADPQDYAGVTK